MIRNLRLLVVCMLIGLAGMAQPQSTVYEGEIGITIGVAHYFGDLNNPAQLTGRSPQSVYFSANNLAIISASGLADIMHNWGIPTNTAI